MKKLVALFLVLTIAAGITACGSTAPASNPSPAPASSAPASESAPPASESAPAASGSATPAPVADAPKLPSGFDVSPLKNDTGKTFRIAIVTVGNGSYFWETMTNAAKDVEAILEKPEYGCTVDFVTVPQHDGQMVYDAIDSCIVKQYDAIVTPCMADSIIPAIDKAMDAGIPVYLFNCQSQAPNKAVAFFGQDLYAAGKLAGEELLKLIGGEGEVAIITSTYTVFAFEQRRNGLLDAFKEAGDKVTVVGTVENFDSADTAYTQAKTFITANPNLKAIYVTGGGNDGVGKAIEDLNMADKVACVSFDFFPESLNCVKNGSIDVLIDQAPPAQSTDALVSAYNQIITGKATLTGNCFEPMDIATPENVAQYLK